MDKIKIFLERVFNCSVFMIINTEIWSFTYTFIIVLLYLIDIKGFVDTSFSTLFITSNIIGLFLIFVGFVKKQYIFLIIAYCLILVPSMYNLFDNMIINFYNVKNYLFYLSNSTIYTRFIWKVLTYDLNREFVGKYGKIRKSCICGE